MSISALSLLYLASMVHAGEWGYYPQGDDVLHPTNWYTDYSLCSGTSQSPIDISWDDALIVQLGNFSFSDYSDTSLDWTLKNNGHTIQVDLNAGNTHTVTHGGLSAGKTYAVAQFHLHWGQNNREGSEHFINGEAYPLELHIVHYDAAEAGLVAAVGTGAWDSLAVLGVMFQIGDDESPVIAHLLDYADHISHDDESYTIPAFDLSSALPETVWNFARYNGSLTTPTCNEIVQWTVFREPLSVTEAQMTELRSAFSYNADTGAADTAMTVNWRPLQPLGDRALYTTYDWSAAGSTAGSAGVLLLSAAAAILLL